jgi:hypothetical protein
MQQIVLVPLNKRSTVEDRDSEELLMLAERATAQSDYVLLVAREGSLAVEQADAATRREEQEEQCRRVATLKLAGAGAEKAWYLIPQDDELAVNGFCPPLPLVRLDEGDFLTWGPRAWLVAAYWRPGPGPAPAELAEKRCPVCGGELRLAPVVQCACGTWKHLERPDEPESKDALNCYLAGGKCACGRQPVMRPEISTELPEKLLAGAEQDADWE